MKDKENDKLIYTGVPINGVLPKLDLSFIQEIPPLTEEEKQWRREHPLTREELARLYLALCPPSLRSSEDKPSKCSPTDKDKSR